jgi:hypothetical protein
MDWRRSSLLNGRGTSVFEVIDRSEVAVFFFLVRGVNERSTFCVQRRREKWDGILKDSHGIRAME